MLEYLKEACGVFGVQNFVRLPIFPQLYWGLRSQNHRGHQSYGFLTFNGKFHLHKGLDLVPKIKRNDIERWLQRLPGHLGVGNVRYATSGGRDETSLIRGTQPFLAETEMKRVVISFNGNVVNSYPLKREIKEKFPGFSYECDSELIGRKILMGLTENGDLPLSIKNCMNEVEGAFSVVGISNHGELFAFKDPHGIKPLCCGHTSNYETCAVSSETVGLAINGFRQDFEVEPGELVIASKEGFIREQLVPCRKRALCAFEFAYFARPDSKLGNKYVYEVREEFGRNLGREYSAITDKDDLIISVPETGNDAAWGLHEETGIRWERALRRHRYITERAFILLAEERYATIDKKINILGHKIRGKRIIVTEDSIVRGDTTKVIVEKLRRLGAEKVHLFITFPRITGPCFYGIDMATYGELIGSRYGPDEIAELIGADTVKYQSLNGFIRATGFSEDELCLGCVTGKYPTPLAQRMADEMREKFEAGHIETGRIYETMNGD